MRLKLMYKMVLFISSLMVAVTALLAYFSWQSGYKSLEQKFGLVLKHIAINTALQIDGHEHMQIRKGSDEKTAAFRRVHAMLEKAMLANYLTPETFYTFNVSENKALKFAVMLQKKKFIGDDYLPPAVNQGYFRRVLLGESLLTGIYSDTHGMWISGLAPIKTGNEVTGIVEADFRVEKFIAELRDQTIQIVVYSSVILAVALLLSIGLSRRISRPIVALRESAAAIAGGKSVSLVKITTHDEIADLQRSFNEMVKSINERYRMLKYLSPHTKRMIEQEIHAPQAAQGELRNVVLFFSDIRGFTRYSADRDPKEVIENLNKVLARQAEIIEAYGGDIDKFVGDEIIAVFEGDKAEHLSLQAAIAIQRMSAANTENAEYDRDLSIGVGIASGEIVMGNIGSVGRKDFTVIGSNVNLASRICSAAGPGEILMSSHVYRKLADETGFLQDEKVTLRKKGNLRAKGFADPIPVYSCAL